jgi:glycosyltransferase involved in cell wall biosynthesis
VQDDRNGLLVPPGDPQALADALVRVLSDRALAERLAAAARPSVEELLLTPQDYAERVAALVEDAVGRYPR